MTTSTESYLRQVEAIFEREGQTRLHVEGLRVDFSVTKESNSDPSPSTVKIYNLTRRSESIIAERGVTLSLFAGYGERLTRLTSGEVRRVDVEVQGQDRIAKILVGQSDSARKETIVTRSYGGPAPVATVLRDVTDEMGLTIDPGVDDLPPMSFEGPIDPDSAENVLTSVLRNSGVEWYETDGEILFAASGKASSVAPFLLNRDSGMVGSPTLTDSGAKAKMLLNGDLSLNQELVIESETVNGSFKVVSITHQGDNWTGEFTTEVEMTRLET